MGGHPSGEVASHIATESVREYLIQRYDRLEKNPRKVLIEALEMADDAVRAKIVKDPRLRGMGTTIVVGFLDGSALHCVHVGDSRAYLIRPPRTIKQITKDHSYVEELVRRGRIDSSQARHHPMKNLITQSIGGGMSLQIDYRRTVLKEGDYVLFCTDGLSDTVPDEFILAEIAESEKLTDACENLIRQANTLGGRDNVTLILVEHRQS